jgi:tetratricopeptide (TPR) repeat protein
LLFRLGRVKHHTAWGGAAELEEARANSLAAGDRETAAEAALMLAHSAWATGSRDGAMAHLGDARSLLAGLPPSRVQAAVLTEAARFDVLADRNERAIEVGREALRMAEELELDELRTRVLTSVGFARVSLGDLGGLEDFEKSIAIASRVKSIANLIRGYNNLGNIKLILGRFEEGVADIVEAHRLAEHYGHEAAARWASGGPMLEDPMHRGRWDELLEVTDAFLADAGDTPHYQDAIVYLFRATVSLGRGDAVNAEQDAEQGLRSARPAMDPQILGTALATAAFIFSSVGNERRATETLDEVLALLQDVQGLGWVVASTHFVAWVARRLGRGDEFLEVVRGEPLESPWLRAARAVAVGDFVPAADILRDAGSLTFEAFYRLQAGTDPDVRAALAFYRSVGATRYVREGEALLAASA